jgi:hypothetical protein
MLVEDERVLLEIPLSVRNWERRKLREAFDEFENDLDRISKLFNAFSNVGRMRMMRTFFERDVDSIAFTELMNKLEMNPKLVWDSTRRLRRVGLIEKDEAGRYRPTQEGEAPFLMATIALRNLLKILDEV